MAGKRIGDHQVGIYKKFRTKLGQEVAAAKVGISVRSAHRLDSTDALPSSGPRALGAPMPPHCNAGWKSMRPRYLAFTVTRCALRALTIAR